MVKVLIIDDDAGILEAVKAILEYGGYEVETAFDLSNILHSKQNELPNIILLDLLLSGNDGKKFARIIKSNNLTKNIPIIMLSAHPDAKSAAISSGADDFLAKPFDMNELLDKINKLINEKYPQHK